MLKSRWLMVALIASLVAMPTISTAQVSDSTKNEAKAYLHGMMRALLGPNWNLFALGGLTTSNQFLLQQVSDPSDGQRALKSGTGWAVGGGAGVDLLLRTGLRLHY